VRLRPPTPDDGAAIWRLAGAAGELEQNSGYAYVLLATHFDDTCLVAEEDGELLGFVVGYRPPRQPDTIFVWQVAVAAAARGLGLGRRLLVELARRSAASGVCWVEATVTPDNEPSRKLFRSLARELGTECAVLPFMSAQLFPAAHEPEELFRLGPYSFPSAPSGAESTAARTADAPPPELHERTR